MKRDLVQLTCQTYDLLVIGGGIYGACVAWDAALRGLTVALVEKNDFGGATSANSLKIIHGGLRYLQNSNLRLVQQMSRERQNWLRIAAHLVRPLPCLMPTTHKLSRSRLALKTALALNDLLSWGRNEGTYESHFLPNGRLLSRQQCLNLLPGLAQRDVTGAAIWHDAQMLNSERLLIAIIQAAVVAGAQAANYVEATDFLRKGSSIQGIQASDRLTGAKLTIQAKVVINCAGAEVDKLLGRLNGRPPIPTFPFSTATNIITPQLFADYAVALPSQTGEMRFVVPWQGHSIIGTVHQPYNGSTSDDDVRETAVKTLINDINFAYPSAALTRQDVTHIHHGFLPTNNANQDTQAVRLLRQGRLYNHEREEGLAGLITVVGVKYTTARHTAEQAVDLALQKLGQPRAKSQTGVTAVYGGNFINFTYDVAQAQSQKPAWLSEASLHHLIQSYGTNYESILAYTDENPMWGKSISPTTSILQAEIIHAIRVEMAQTLADVIQRRTSLGAVGLPDASAIKQCAALATAELKWTAERRAQEIEVVYAAYGQSPPQPIHDDGHLGRNGHHKKEEITSLTAVF
jgi:glycerol-3-phosphate dehydrogenase